MTGTAGVIDRARRLFTPGQQRRQRQAHQDESANWLRREVLAFTLFHSLVEKAFEQVAEKLVVLVIAGQTDVLPHLQNFQQHLGVLVKETLVVDVDE